MKHLGISGGSTKIAGLAGAAFQCIEKFNYKPDVISGISAGSILTLPIVFKKWEMLEKVVKNLKLSDFFDISPVTTSGGFTLRGIIRVILGKESLGSEKNLIKELKAFITPCEFEEYKNNASMPIVYIGTVDFANASRQFFNLKEVDYDTFLKCVLASSSIPIFTENVLLKEAVTERQMYLFDGGVRQHIATPWILQNVKDITESVSIYSRPENYDIGAWSPGNVLDVLERYVDITNVEISKSDETLEDLLCEKFKIKQTKIFLPKILTSLYDVDPTRLAALYNAGMQSAADAMLVR